MTDNNEMVTSVFGRMSRRELLRYMAGAGLGFGVAGGSLLQAPLIDAAGDTVPPPKALGGTPFREITKAMTFYDEKFDIRPLQKAGTPKPRSRDTSWLDKPSNALGVSLLQFTNPASIIDNSCSQAATATILNFYKKAPAGLAGDKITENIYAEFPPDGGERGTSFRHTVKTLEGYGLKTWSGRSNELGVDTMIEKLKTYVSQGRPCTLLLDMREPKRSTGGGTDGHFVVVYAYTDTHVFMTNWNYNKRNGWLNDWTTFKTAWSLPDSQNHHLMAVGWA